VTSGAQTVTARLNRADLLRVNLLLLFRQRINWISWGILFLVFFAIEAYRAGGVGSENLLRVFIDAAHVSMVAIVVTMLWCIGWQVIFYSRTPGVLANIK
jgi:hypothetical protein